MKTYERNEIEQTFTMQSFLGLLRALGAILGGVVIGIGVTYAARTFGLIYTALKQPESFEAHLDRWATALGGDRLDVVVEGATYPGAELAAIAVMGVGVMVLAWMSMGLILTGAKTISWTLSDREAVKRLLTHAFGAQGKAPLPPPRTVPPPEPPAAPY